MGPERRGDTSVAACPPQCRDLGHVEDYGRILPCLRCDALELRLPAPAIARHNVAARGEIPGVLSESQEAMDTGAQRRDEPRARNGMARHAVADFVENGDDVLAAHRCGHSSREPLQLAPQAPCSFGRSHDTAAQLVALVSVDQLCHRQAPRRSKPQLVGSLARCDRVHPLAGGQESFLCHLSCKWQRKAVDGTECHSLRATAVALYPVAHGKGGRAALADADYQPVHARVMQGQLAFRRRRRKALEPLRGEVECYRTRLRHVSVLADGDTPGTRFGEGMSGCYTPSYKGKIAQNKGKLKGNEGKQGKGREHTLVFVMMGSGVKGGLGTPAREAMTG